MPVLTDLNGVPEVGLRDAVRRARRSPGPTPVEVVEAVVLLVDDDDVVDVTAVADADLAPRTSVCSRLLSDDEAGCEQRDGDRDRESCACSSCVLPTLSARRGGESRGTGRREWPTPTRHEEFPATSGRRHRDASNARSTRGEHQEVWQPQRDSNPCRHLERVVS